MGLFVLVAIAAMFGFAVADLLGHEACSVDGFGCLEMMLFRYQTLITGVLAVIGALWTVDGIRRQMIQADTFNSHQHGRFRKQALAQFDGELTTLQTLTTLCKTARISATDLGVAGEKYMFNLDISVIDDAIVDRARVTCSHFVYDQLKTIASMIRDFNSLLPDTVSDDGANLKTIEQAYSKINAEIDVLTVRMESRVRHIEEWYVR